MRKYVKSNDGYALVIALLVITVVTVLGLGILTTTSSSKKLSEEESKDQTAYYIAEAGLNQKKEELKDAKVVYDDFVKSVKDQKLTKEQFIEKLDARAKLELKQQLEDTTYGSDLFNRKNARANVKTVMTVSETELKFTITSTGIIKSTDSANEKKRTVQSVDSYNMNISDSNKGLGKYVTYITGNSLKLSGGKSVVDGLIGFEKPMEEVSIKMTGHKNNGNGNGNGNTNCTPNSNDENDGDGCLEKKGILYEGSAPYKPFPYEKFTDSEKLKACKLNNLPLSKILETANRTSPPKDVKSKIDSNTLSGNYNIKSTDLQSKEYAIPDNTIVNIFITGNFNIPNNIRFTGNGTINFYVDNIYTNNSLNISFDNNNVYFFTKNQIEFTGVILITKVKNLYILSEKALSFNNSLRINDTENINLYSNTNINLFGSFRVDKGKSIDICTPNSINFDLSYDLNAPNINAYAQESTTFKGYSPVVHSGNFDIYTKKLIMKSSNAKSYFSTGPTNFYVIDDLTIEDKTFFDNFNIYYKGTKNVAINQNLNTTINFDILKSFISSNHFKDTSYKGVIVLRYPLGNETQIYPNHTGSLHFYAPQTDVKINGNKTFHGAIGGKNIHLAGNIKLYYKAPYPNSILKFSSSGGGNNGSISSDISKNPDGGSIEVNNP